VLLREQAPLFAGGEGGNTRGSYVYPVTEFIYPVLLVGILGTSVIPLAGAAVLGVVDWMDLGRMPVAQEGCCRDEPRLRAAARPGPGRRIAPLLAAAGGVATMTFPVLMMVTTAALALVVGSAVSYNLVTVPLVPGPTLSTEAWATVYLTQMVIGSTSIVGIFVVGLGALAGALLLMSSEYAPVVDRG